MPVTLYNCSVITVILLKITKQIKVFIRIVDLLWGVKFMFYNQSIKNINLLHVSKKGEKLSCKNMLSLCWSVIQSCRGHKLCTEFARCQDFLCLNFSWPACSLFFFFFSWFGCDSNFSSSLELSGWFALHLFIFLWCHHGLTSAGKYRPGRTRETQGPVWRGRDLGWWNVEHRLDTKGPTDKEMQT